MNCAFCGDPIQVPSKKLNQIYHSLCQPAIHQALKAWARHQLATGHVTCEELFKYVPADMHWTPPTGYTRSGKRKLTLRSSHA